MVSKTSNKKGKQFYLGIEIDYDKEKNLDNFSLDTLKDRYFWKDETHAQEAFARAATYCSTYKGVTDFNLAQRLYNYASDIGLGLVLLYLVTQELVVASLLAAFLIMFLIQGLVYLIITMKTFGLQVEVEASVDLGLVFAATVLALLTVVSLLVLSLSCIL
tara:strand:- start:3050 stop:3532 length:483 start_codon:yes stop_codon:yes gene_type:complete